MSDTPLPIKEIRVDVSELELGDVEKLMEGGANALPFKDQLDLLDRVVIGGARHVKIKDVPLVMEAIQKAIDEFSNPPTPELTLKETPSP